MSSDDYAYVPEVEVVRRPTPEAPPPFVCVVCERTIDADPWHVQREPHRHKPPICWSCTNWGSLRPRLFHITRGDNRELARLVAVTDALNREAFNHETGRHLIMENGGTHARSEASPLGERFNLDDIISGLARDLEDVRAGRMSVEAARAQADLAKQLFNGIRLVVNAQKYLEVRALPITPDEPRA